MVKWMQCELSLEEYQRIKAIEAMIEEELLEEIEILTEAVTEIFEAPNDNQY